MTPLEAAMALPSCHGFATDVLAHMQPGGYVLSTPDYFLLARPVEISREFRDKTNGCHYQKFTGWDTGYQGQLDALTNPFTRYENPNAWCIGVLAGDMVKAWTHLEAIVGSFEFVAWQDRGGCYRWRRTGPAFNKFLRHVQARTHPEIPAVSRAGLAESVGGSTPLAVRCDEDHKAPDCALV